MSDILSILSQAAWLILGVYVGIEIKSREKPTLQHRFGQHIQDTILKVLSERKWCGPGCEISVTEKLQCDDREVEIVVREVTS